MQFFKILVIGFSCFSLAQVQGLKVEMVGHIPLEQFPDNPSRLSDIWGYTDAEGRPYALVTAENGVTVFDISEPSSPVEVGNVPLSTSRWKDIKTYKYDDGRAFAFATADGVAGVGLTVIDLSNLPESIRLVDQHQFYTDAHNIFIDPDNASPYAYIAIAGIGSESGLITVDISDPENPVVVSHFRDYGVHDLYVSRNWANPEWNGKDMAVLFSESYGIVILDMTDKANPVELSRTQYDGLAYSHSGWADKTGRYIYAFDELDELSYGLPTTMRTFDIYDPTAPVEVHVWEGYGFDIDHNGIVKDDKLYIANYTAGLTILDLSNPAEPTLVAQNYPFQAETAPSMNGYWGVYPLFDTNIVICSDINNGLAVLEFSEVDEPTLVYGPSELKLCSQSTQAGELTVSLFAPETQELPLSVVSAPEGIQINFPKTSITTGETLKVAVVPSPEVPATDFEATIAAGDLEMTFKINMLSRDANLNILNPVNGEYFVSRDDLPMYWYFNQEATSYQLTYWSKPDRSDSVSFSTRRYWADISSSLAANTTYYWQVQANGICDSTTSEVQSFTTAGTRILVIEEGGDRSSADHWASITGWNGVRIDRRTADAQNFLRDINDYELVIWHSGNNRDGAGPNRYNEPVLETYVNNGGFLIINSNGYYEARGNTTDGFMNDVLGVRSVTNRGAIIHSLESSIYSQNSNSTTLLPDHASDRLIPSSSAQAILSDPDTGHVVGVRKGRTMYISTPTTSMSSFFFMIDFFAQYYLENLTLELEEGLYRQYIPINPRNMSMVPKLHLYNLSDQTNDVTINAVDSAGRVLSKARPSLNGYGMVILDQEEMMGLIPHDFNYLVITGSQPVHAMMDARGHERGFALNAASQLSPQLYVPHIAADTESFFTRGSFSNVSNSSTTVNFHVESQSYDLDLDRSLGSHFFDFAELFGDQMDGSHTRGIARAGGNSASLMGAEVFGANQFNQAAGLTLSGEATHSLYFNHIANTAADWWTGMSAYNPGNTDATVNTQAYAADGTPIASATVTILAGDRIVDAVISGSRGRQFFPEGLPESAAWFKLDSDQPLVGYSLFSDAQNRLFSGLEATSQALTHGVIPFVGDKDRYAGLAFVNDTDAAQTINLTLRDGSGVFAGSATVDVPARGRVTATGESLFGNALLSKNTYVQMSANGGVHAFVIYGDFRSTWLSGVNAMPGLD